MYVQTDLKSEIEKSGYDPLSIFIIPKTYMFRHGQLTTYGY